MQPITWRAWLSLCHSVHEAKRDGEGWGTVTVAKNHVLLVLHRGSSSQECLRPGEGETKGERRKRWANAFMHRFECTWSVEDGIAPQTKKRKFEPPIPTRVGKKKKIRGPEAANKLPQGKYRQ